MLIQIVALLLDMVQTKGGATFCTCLILPLTSVARQDCPSHKVNLWSYSSFSLNSLADILFLTTYHELSEAPHELFQQSDLSPPPPVLPVHT